MYYPMLEEVKKRKKDGNLIPVYREIVADLETPVSAFLKVSRGGYSFLLESVEGGERLARYSFMGTEPYRVLTSKGEDKTNPLPLIADELKKYKIVPVGELPRFCGGAVGYLSYEAATRFEELPSPVSDPLGLPEALFMFVDTMLVFDHVSHKIKVLSYVHLDGDIEEAYQRAVGKIDDLVDRLNRPLEPSQHSKTAALSQDDYSLSSNFSREEFEASVQKIKQYITSGETIQVVLSQRLAQPTTAAPFEIYRALRSLNPSPYMFFLDFTDFCIIGASPEILVRVEDGIVMTRPLAGTRPRGKNPDEDIMLEQELRHDEKERAEHIMLVDLGRNDIGRVSEPGTVKVSDLMEVERYSHVMHLVTHVQGKLRSDLTAFDALQACFPAGTVSGAPKIRAMEMIAELEPEKRGPYAGAAGYFSFSGNMDMAIAIRTMVVTKGVAYVQAGCGVVYDSVPELEYQETLNKAQALLKAISQAESSSGATRRSHAVID
ncbi:MAG: anthranilate synthase component I [Chloroflexi bacterium]|nr:anthranilate synthase component I [Chloroflexota bacterium]MBM3175538.1 anthranilate synthase component I [Chloroflexota bacterium]MBM4451239.1 anthranilate synthase component I [Chloroflexota bacterium]